ncbi:hypothetical protein [Haladaptatus sp. DJG-WS-42]|uniref:hypothetical protein n=1 Tax=Haladaptatus sp. DJG-WS-42 TaxID=3120516 RepID=UPI0030D05308
MVPTLRSLFLGSKQPRWLFVAFLTCGLFALTFAAYAVGLFRVTGGVVFIPYDAALVGVLAAFGVGYARRGLLVAWIFAYASLLGYLADHAFFGLSYRPFLDQLGYFLQLDGLAFLAVEALVLGTLAFIVGMTVSAVIAFVRRERLSSPQSR